MLRSRLALPLGSRMRAICKPASGRIPGMGPCEIFKTFVLRCRCTYYFYVLGGVSPTTTNSYRMRVGTIVSRTRL